MIWGNRKSIAIEIEPLNPSWERRYLPESTAWANFRFWVNEINLCQHVLSGSDQIQNGVNVPLGALANWFVQSWPALSFEERPSIFPSKESAFDTVNQWGVLNPPKGVSEDSWYIEREKWWARHFWHAGADGAQIPNVAFWREDEILVVSVARSSFAGTRAPRFITEDGSYSVRWDEASDVIRSFVAAVADFFRSADVQAFPWTTSKDPLTVAEEHQKQALEFYTARSSAELHKVLAAAEIRELGVRGDPGGHPVTQAMRDLPPHLDRNTIDSLKALNAITGEKTPNSLDGPRKVALDAEKAGRNAEEMGQLAAMAVRASMGLNGQPIENLEQVVKSLGIRQKKIGNAAREKMVVGMRREGSAAILIRSLKRWAQRFEIARAFGHLLLDSERSGAIGAASSSYAQVLRRRRSGAFAAEFLLPTTALKKYSAGRLDGITEGAAFSKMIRDYDVGATTAAYQLWNQNYLSSEQVRDELIQTYGAQPETK